MLFRASVMTMEDMVIVGSGHQSLPLPTRVYTIPPLPSLEHKPAPSRTALHGPSEYVSSEVSKLGGTAAGGSMSSPLTSPSDGEGDLDELSMMYPLLPTLVDRRSICPDERAVLD